MKKLLQNQKKNKFVLCVLLLALLASLALMTGCGNNDAQDGDAGADGQDTAKETLVVGLDDTFAPMGFRDEQGNLQRRWNSRPARSTAYGTECPSHRSVRRTWH